MEEACASGTGGQVNVLITQPRRVAATSVANRIAVERAEPLGNSVGYTIRLERHLLTYKYMHMYILEVNKHCIFIRINFILQLYSSSLW